VTKLPSAVTVAGVPVAVDGGLVYLGGGLYAAPVEAEAPKPLPKRKPRQRTLPGRVSMMPRPLGSKSAMRSASAHVLGSAMTLLSPGASQVRSEASASGSSGSRVWRPSGPAKLPPPPPEPPGGRRKALDLENMDSAPGVLHSAARAEAREDAARRDSGLFGDRGILAQLREGEECLDAGRRCSSSIAYGGAVGPPLSSEARAAERRAAKDERNRLLLEERAMRLAVDAEAAALKRKRAMAPFKAPAPQTVPESASGFDSVEKARLRVASKLEIMDFFKGYSKTVGSMSAEQTRELLAKLAGPREELPDCRQHLEGDQGLSERYVDDHYGPEPSIQERLFQANEMGNRIFQAVDEDELEF